MTHAAHPPFKHVDFQALFASDGLGRLDAAFIDYLAHTDSHLANQLHDYRHQKINTNPEISALVIACAPILEAFIAQFFQIENEVAALYQSTHYHDPVFQFKDYYVHHAKRLMKSVVDLERFESLNTWLLSQLNNSDDMELAVASLGMHFLSNENHFKDEIEKLIHWCVLAQQCDEGRKIIQHWRSFHLPKKKHFENLVPMVPVKEDPFGRFEGPVETQRQRDGFTLTDPRMPLRHALNEIHYCVYCHKNEGDFCSKGFPVKKNNPKLGLKINPAGDVLTGCPLEEKISEMHVMKKAGFGIGALAIVMIDNPMCAVTGHRICNDCMKACIYQKQDPVNIPEIETRVLTDVLNLPWGVEIYDLLMRWNPLRQTQFLQKPYNHQKILVMGMGPAGFTLAHHLLMEGCAVVGCDGLKIEPLPAELLTNPIRDFNSLKESLDNRIMSGFGGVTEYGITVRWDKNFLKLIYLSLARRSHFQLFGNVRLGGTITVENAWSLGFDHVAITVGAGLPRELRIPNSLAPGMRQANDFLMALQLTGAYKKSSLANLQIRLPVVVIGGGLTGIDTATEVQAYYITQVEKIHQRYHVLKQFYSEEQLRAHFEAHDLTIIDEYLFHADKIIAEREQAHLENRAPNLIALIREWGGVTVAYRKSIQESPAYQRNHEEVIKALEEGIYYAEGLEPDAVTLDEHGDSDALICRWRIQDEFGQWIWSSEKQTLPAKSILVATGAKPNIAYEFEHRGSFVKSHDAYQTYEDCSGVLNVVENREHVKTETVGIFTSYDKDGHRVSFLGDTHPVFHGSVVKAIASAKRGYPKIVAALQKQREAKCVKPVVQSHDNFRAQINHLLSAEITALKRHTENILELTIKAPLAAIQFKPGQFYRIQNYETHAQIINDTKLQTETLSALGIFNPEYPDQLSFFIAEKGASARLVSTFEVGQPIALMGPTGVKAKIPTTPETFLIIGDEMAAIYLLSVGPALKATGSTIHLAVNISEKNRFAWDRIRAIADHIYFYKSNELTHTLQVIDLSAIQHVFVIGRASLLKEVQHTRQHTYFSKETSFTASVYSSMQCMLKGVCAQCLQWQIDPVTGKRTKAVYSCSWQHQPIEMIDIDNINERLRQNRAQEILTNLWLGYLLTTNEIGRV